MLGLVVTPLAASVFSVVPAGQIKGARLSWVSTNSIKIGVGYGEVMGAYWEIGSTDTLVTTGYTLTGLTPTANGVFHYIYIDRVNSSFPYVAIRNSTTAPTWSADYMGWYSGPDRCIGAVWAKPDGTLLNFLCPEDDVYIGYATVALSSSSVDTATNTWYTLDINPYTPVNSYSVLFRVELWGSWSRCTAGIAREANVYANVQSSGVTNTTLTDWVPFERGANRKVRWMAFASSSGGTLWREITGYKIER